MVDNTNNSKNNLSFKESVDNACFIPSIQNSELCYGGYPWCYECELYIHQEYLRSKNKKNKK